MTPELAAKAYDIYVSDKTGFFRKPVFDAEGIKTVLALRSKYGVPQKTLNGRQPDTMMPATWRRPASSNGSAHGFPLPPKRVSRIRVTCR